MKNYKFEIGILTALISTIPCVSADVVSGPELIIIPIVGLALIGLFIVGAIFLIRWIIKKIKSKQ